MVTEHEKESPKVEDHEQLVRAITSPTFWNHRINTPSSAAFRKDVFSVDIESRSDLLLFAARFGEKLLALVRFNCGEARNNGFDAREEIDEEYPENLAHAHVYMRDWDGLSNNERRLVAKKLVKVSSAIPGYGN